MVVDKGVRLDYTSSPTELVCLNSRSGSHQYERVYSVYGLSTSINSNGGGLGAKTGLYLVKDS